MLATRLGTADRTVLFDTDRFVHPVGFADGHLIFVRGTSLLAQPFDAASLRLRGEPVPLVDRVEPIPNLPYGFASAAGSALAYVPATNPNVHQLTWFDRAGRETALLGEPGNYSSLELAPDQTRAVVAVMDPARRNHDIWVFDVKRALRTRLTFEPGDERTAIWSPASDRLILNRQQKGTERDLFVKAADGSGREAPAVVNGLSKDAMSVSPDGRWLLYRESSKMFNDIWVTPLDGSGKPAPFIATEFDENYARFSPDGRWVVYSSAESGRWEVYVVPFPGPGGKWQVSSAGGELPRWRGDGREIFYLAPDGNLVSVAVDGRSSAFQVGQAVAALPSAHPVAGWLQLRGQRRRPAVPRERLRRTSNPGGHHRRLAGAGEEVGGLVIAAFVIGVLLVASTAGAQTDAAPCNLSIAPGVSPQQLVSGAAAAHLPSVRATGL